MVALTAALALSGDAWAAEQIRGPVAATVERVVDGDTLDVRALIWLGQSVNVRVRIDGVDAPELGGHCAEEARRAEAARAYLVRRLRGAEVRLTAIAYDKYGGRVRASVSDGAGDVATALIAKGFARPYRGERRLSWCSA
jgi:endonuclease YncB( thermonuclease family)